ncbi:hypothetical protein BKA57DRAFT_471424 [Linnemannia elongata]|nr:hypothetical protein BKA57DRAFT_471424 [Linnemannia elongata]
MNCQKGTSHLHKHRQPIQDQHCALDRHFLLGASVYPALFLWFPQTLFHAIHPSCLHFSLLTLLPFFPPSVCLCACGFCLWLLPDWLFDSWSALPVPDFPVVSGAVTVPVPCRFSIKTYTIHQPNLAGFYFQLRRQVMGGRTQDDR